MVVYEDGVEAVFFSELCSLDDLREGFVSCLEDSASELDLTFHTSATRSLSSAISARNFIWSIRGLWQLKSVFVFFRIQLVKLCVESFIVPLAATSLLSLIATNSPRYLPSTGIFAERSHSMSRCLRRASLLVAVEKSSRPDVPYSESIPSTLLDGLDYLRMVDEDLRQLPVDLLL